MRTSSASASGTRPLGHARRPSRARPRRRRAAAGSGRRCRRGRARASGSSCRDPRTACPASAHFALVRAGERQHVRRRLPLGSRAAATSAPSRSRSRRPPSPRRETARPLACAAPLSKNGVQPARCRRRPACRPARRRRRPRGRRPGRDRRSPELAARAAAARTKSRRHGDEQPTRARRHRLKDYEPFDPHLQNNARQKPCRVNSSPSRRGPRSAEAAHFSGCVQRDAVAAGVLRFVERLVGEGDDVVGVLDRGVRAAPRRRR